MTSGLTRKDRLGDIYTFLAEQGIEYQRQEHPPVFTCEEGLRLVPPLPGAKTKNLFLRDRKGRRHFLVVVGYEKAVDLRALKDLLGVPGRAQQEPDKTGTRRQLQGPARPSLRILSEAGPFNSGRIIGCQGLGKPDGLTAKRVVV